MLQALPDDLENLGLLPPGGDGGPGPAPELTLPDEKVDPLAAIKLAQADADKKKAYLGVFGSIAQGLANRPSAYELYTGKTSARPDFKGMSDAAAASISDPMTQQQKAYAFLKAKSEAGQAQDQDAFKERLKDDDSPAAKSFKQMLISTGGDPAAINSTPALDLYTQGYSPSRMSEIKAKSNVEFGDKAKLFQMEQAERTKDKKDLMSEKHKDKGADDYQKFVQSVEQHASSLRGDDAAKLSSAKLSAIASGRALLKQYEGREDEMTPDQLSILAADRVKAVTGGVPTNEEMKAMMPHNAGTSWAGTKSYWTGSPEAAHSGGWVKEAEKDFQVQEKAARDILKNRQDQITSNPKLKPEDKARISKMAVPPEYLSPSTAAPETKIVNGLTYQKVPGGWQQVETVGQK